MSMTVLELQRSTGDSRYQADSFRNVIEDHLQFIKHKSIANVVTTTGRQVSKFKLDFTGLLIELNVPDEYHWATMRANGLHSTADYVNNYNDIKLIKTTTLRSLHERHLTNVYQR